MNSLLRKLKLERPKSQQQSQQTPKSNSWLVVGLGNPGPNYQHNRHNVGQMVVDDLARRFSTKFKSHRSGSLVAEFKMVGGSKIVLAKSTGFMNLSGNPVSKLLKFYSIETSRLIVVHDELDLPFGEIRTKFDGGHAGHNGLRDITQKCGSAYHRVRFGIGRPPGQMPVADFVLRDFASKEKSELPALVAVSAEKVAEIIESSGS